MSKTRYLLIALIGLSGFLFGNKLHAQSVGIGNASFTPDVAAMLEIRSPAGAANAKGILIPRVTYADRPSTAASPGSDGMLIYQTDDNGSDLHGFWYFDTGVWYPFLSSSSSSSTAGWITTGNNGTTALNNFLGTRDNASLTFRTNNIQRVRIDSLGNVGIGLTIPTATLHVYGSGAKTAAYQSELIQNVATSSTASIAKTGLEVQSTGTWDGASSTNTGIAVTSVTGGTANYDATFNGGGNVGIGTSTPNNARLQVTDANSTSGFSGLRIDQSGAAAGASYGTLVTKTGASTVNIGGYFSANGGTSNYGLYGATAANGGIGVNGSNTSTGLAIQYGVTGNKAGATDGVGIGVYGNSSGSVVASATSINYGGWFQAKDANTCVGGYFYVSNAITNAYAIIVPSAGGKVGIGTSAPVALLQVTGATLGSEVFRMETANGNSYPTEQVFQGRGTTTTNAFTTLMTIPITTAYTTMIEIEAVGRRTAGGTADNGAGYIRYATFKGTSPVVQIGATTLTATHESNAASYDIQYLINGTNVEIQLKGATGETLMWNITAHIWTVKD